MGCIDNPGLPLRSTRRNRVFALLYRVVAVFLYSVCANWEVKPLSDSEGSQYRQGAKLSLESAFCSMLCAGQNASHG